MHRIEWIDGNRVCGGDFHDVGFDDIAVLGRKILFQYAVIVDGELSHCGGHPAILVFVIMDGRLHAYFPADSHQFV